MLTRQTATNPHLFAGVVGGICPAERWRSHSRAIVRYHLAHQRAMDSNCCRLGDARGEYDADNDVACKKQINGQTASPAK